MQVILLEKVINLGNLGYIVRVKDGYARNFLIPSKKARRATQTAIDEFEVKRADLEKAAADKLAAAQAEGEKLNGLTVQITQKSGVDGRLFGSVTSEDIANAIKQARGLRIDRRKVHLENPIRTTGTHMVTIEVHDGVTADVKTIVTPEG